MKVRPRLGGRTKACVACKLVLPLASFPPVKLHHRSRICATCEAAGKTEAPKCVPDGPRPRLSPRQRGEIRERLAAGESAGLLAFTYGTSLATIKAYATQLKREAEAPAPKYEGELAASPHRVQVSLNHEPRADGALLSHTQTARVAAVVPRQGVRLSPAIAGYLSAFGIR